MEIAIISPMPLTPHLPDKLRWPLPVKDFLTLCELITWLVTGKARGSSVLRRLMQRNNGARKPEALWREMEQAATNVISLLRQDRITAYGSMDSGIREPILKNYLVNEVFAEFAVDLIAPDPMAFVRDEYPHGLQKYRNVCFLCADVAQVFVANQPKLKSVSKNTAPEQIKQDPLSSIDYRSLKDIADLWSVEPQPPGTKDRIFWTLVKALCDGAFFKDGVAVQVHAWLLSSSSGDGDYSPYSPSVELLPDGKIKTGPPNRLPDIEQVENREAFIGYVEPYVGEGNLSVSLLSSPDVFYDWVKHMDPEQLDPEVRRILFYTAISGKAFRNWCVDSGTPIPTFVERWLDANVGANEAKKPEIVISKSAAGSKSLRWLESLMRQGPQLEPKSYYLNITIERYGVTERQFGRVWETAKLNTGNKDWGKPGRRKK